MVFLFAAPSLQILKYQLVQNEASIILLALCSTEQQPSKAYIKFSFVISFHPKLVIYMQHSSDPLRMLPEIFTSCRCITYLIYLELWLISYKCLVSFTGQGNSIITKAYTGSQRMSRLLWIYSKNYINVLLLSIFLSSFSQ